MKSLIQYGLLALTVCCLTSCPFHEPEFADYFLYLSFQDTSGKDLVEGIELDSWTLSNRPMEEAGFGTVKSDLYILNIVASEACNNHRCKNDRLSYMRVDNKHYFSFGLSFSTEGDCPESAVLVYRLSCPYVFGDNELHEIVSPNGCTESQKHVQQVHPHRV